MHSHYENNFFAASLVRRHLIPPEVVDKVSIPTDEVIQADGLPDEEGDDSVPLELSVKYVRTE